MRLTAILGVLVLLVPGSVQAAGAPGAVDPVVAELAKLNGALREIAALLKKQGEGQDLDLLMKRLQLSDARLADSERALQSAESELRSLENDRGQIDQGLKMIAARMEQMEQAGEDVALVELEATQAEGELKRIRQRIGDLTIEISGLESAVASRREEVRASLSALDRRLTPQ